MEPRSISKRRNIAPDHDHAHLRRRATGQGQERMQPSDTAPNDQGIHRTTNSIFCWLKSFLGLTFHLIKIPLAIVFTIWLFTGFAATFYHGMFTNFAAEWTPFCRLPGVSLLQIEMCKGPSGHQGNSGPHVDFRSLASLHAPLQVVVDRAASSRRVRDYLHEDSNELNKLRAIVSLTNLKNKDDLGGKLKEYGEKADNISLEMVGHVHRIDLEVSGIVFRFDQIRQLLEEAEAKNKTSTSSTMISDSNLFETFRPLPFTDDAFTDDGVSRFYLFVIRETKNRFSLLLTSAERLTKKLVNLKVVLQEVQTEGVKGGWLTNEDEVELRDEVWTRLGGGKRMLRVLNRDREITTTISKTGDIALANLKDQTDHIVEMKNTLEYLEQEVINGERSHQEEETTFKLQIAAFKEASKKLQEQQDTRKEFEHFYSYNRFNVAKQIVPDYHIDGPKQKRTAETGSSTKAEATRPSWRSIMLQRVSGFLRSASSRLCVGLGCSCSCPCSCPCPCPE